MNKDKVRTLLKEFFKNRDIEKDVQKLFPIMDEKRLQAILDGQTDFNKADATLIISVAMEFGQDNRVYVDPKLSPMIDKLRAAIDEK